MANFNNNAVTVFQTAEEAAITIANSTANGSGAGQLEHDVLLDAVQTLALGDISLTAVIGTGISLALQDGGYQVGRTYDYFDANQTAAQICAWANKNSRSGNFVKVMDAGWKRTRRLIRHATQATISAPVTASFCV